MYQRAELGAENLIAYFVSNERWPEVVVLIDEIHGEWLMNWAV